MSVRSLLAPGCATGAAKSRKVGVEVRTSRSSRRKKGARSSANGLVTLVSSIELVQGPPQLTNVVFARRSVPGRKLSAWREADVLVPDRLKDRIGVGDETGDVVAPLGERPDEPGGVDQEVLEDLLVGRELAASPAAVVASAGPKYLNDG